MVLIAARAQGAYVRLLQGGRGGVDKLLTAGDECLVYACSNS